MKTEGGIEKLRTQGKNNHQLSLIGHRESLTSQTKSVIYLETTYWYYNSYEGYIFPINAQLRCYQSSPWNSALLSHEAFLTLLDWADSLWSLVMKSSLVPAGSQKPTRRLLEDVLGNLVPQIFL